MARFLFEPVIIICMNISRTNSFEAKISFEHSHLDHGPEERVPVEHVLHLLGLEILVVQDDEGVQSKGVRLKK